MKAFTTFALVTLACNCTCTKLKDFSFTRDVEEGGWANYSCTIKSIKKASIFWRIGDYTSEGGDSIQQVCNLKEINVQVKSADNTEKIDILATMELNGMPVQCKVVPYVITSRAREEYSQFALLRVHPSNGLGAICAESSGDDHHSIHRRDLSSRELTSASKGMRVTTTTMSIAAPIMLLSVLLFLLV